MKTYIIGDIQGCFDELQLLLKKIQYDSKIDVLIFVGDLVNRGPKSFETLEFIYHLPNKKIVLGNHDLYLIRLFYDALPKNKLHHDDHTLDKILNHPEASYLIDWLRHQSLFYKNEKQKYCIVHAGIPPQWNLNETEQYADEVCHALRQHDFKIFLANMFGNTPDCWTKELKNFDRLRYITNALTRMRFCNAQGCLDVKTTGIQSPLENYRAWFEWQNKNLNGYEIYFGHWAALQGKCNVPHIHALDTGCVWGGKLTALCVETGEKNSVNSKIPEK